MPGKITIFTTADCPHCAQTRNLLSETGAEELAEINIEEKPEWEPLLFLITGGSSTPPHVFFNATYVGGLAQLQHVAATNELRGIVADCLSESDPPPFPPQLRIPDPTEYFQLVPIKERENWQSYIDELCSTLSRPDKQVELVLMMMDTPAHKMVIVCSAGAASAQFPVGGAGADKKTDDTGEKLYCQMVMQEKKTFFNYPTNLSSALQSNIDLVKYGYGYYIGAPWSVGDIRGTIVSLEKEAGVLQEEHVPIIEQVRNEIEQEWRIF